MLSEVAAATAGARLRPRVCELSLVENVAQ